MVRIHHLISSLSLFMINLNTNVIARTNIFSLNSSLPFWLHPVGSVQQPVHFERALHNLCPFPSPSTCLPPSPHLWGAALAPWSCLLQQSCIPILPGCPYAQPSAPAASCDVPVSPFLIQLCFASAPAVCHVLGQLRFPLSTQPLACPGLWSPFSAPSS